MIEQRKFKIHSKFKPAGSQPEAINKLVEKIKNGHTMQTLLGITGSGKTFSMANIIEKTQMPALIIAHNKTLAAQLYAEFKELFPDNRVEYFVSFYDYYQPESYIATKDQYIEKDSDINETIERMRLAATASLMSRSDTIIVASVSCIYGLGNPKNYSGMGFDIEVGKNVSRKELMSKFLSVQYERNDIDLISGRFRVKGDTIDIIPSYMSNIIRIELFGNIIERISELDKVTGKVIDSLKYFFLFPARHFVTPQDTINNAIASIKQELSERLPQLDLIESHRLKQRTEYDLELIEQIGFCKGIENYSRHFDGRNAGEKPYCLLDYFPKEFLIFVDESHQSLPQFRAMYHGDLKRKESLVDYGFRLPSALDNRPLKFEEFEKYLNEHHTVFVSATPAEYEKSHSSQVVEQIIRPTGLVDPPVFVRPTKNQMDDLRDEISATIKRGDRILVTALTKKFAEELSDFFASVGIKSRYLHSEVKTLERTEIIRQLREGRFDVLVGINLLREGLDIPEVGFIGVLDADKEGFLRNTSSLIQIIGRAARNVNAKVVLYADELTQSMNDAMSETSRRRTLQLAYNKEHGIIARTIKKKIEKPSIVLQDTKHIPKKEKERMVTEMELEMRNAAKMLDFELAIALRDRIAQLNKELKK